MNNQTKHTPGPWKSALGQNQKYYPGWFNIWQVDRDGNLAHTEIIASVCGYLHPAEANARLIATAPEILEFCKALLKCWALEPHEAVFPGSTLRDELETVVGHAEQGTKKVE